MKLYRYLLILFCVTSFGQVSEATHKSNVDTAWASEKAGRLEYFESGHGGDMIYFWVLFDAMTDVFVATGDTDYLEDWRHAIMTSIDLAEWNYDLPSTDPPHHYLPRSTSQMNGLTSTPTNTKLDNTTTGTTWQYNGSSWVDLEVDQNLDAEEPNASTVNRALSPTTGNYYKTSSYDDYLDHDNHGDRISTNGYTSGGLFELYDKRGWSDAPRMLLVWKNNPEILGWDNGDGGTYQDDYDVIIDYCETHIWDKWTDRGRLWNGTTHIASHIAKLGFLMYELTGKEKFSDAADIFLDDMSDGGEGDSGSFRGNLRAHASTVAAGFGAGYVWSAGFGSTSGATDMHSNDEADFVAIANMFDNTLVTDSETAKFVSTLRYLISLDYPYPGRIDGDKPSEPPANFGEGWASLGRHSAALQLDLEGATITREEVMNNETIWHSKLLYNRAYLNGTRVYPEEIVSEGVVPTSQKVNARRNYLQSKIKN